jgi:tetratricopeptide (TPR) repeat protein
MLDVEENKIDASFEKFSRAVQLDGRLFRKSCDVYLDRLNRPDLAIALAGDRSYRLLYVVDRLEDLTEHDELAGQARQQLFELLKFKSQAPDAPAWIFASLANQYKRQDAFTEAIEYYRRALGLDYDQVYWRLELAKLLARIDQPAEAIHEARICLRLDPQLRAAEKLIEDLSVLPVSLKETKQPLPAGQKGS